MERALMRIDVYDDAIRPPFNGVSIRHQSTSHLTPCGLASHLRVGRVHFAQQFCHGKQKSDHRPFALFLPLCKTCAIALARLLGILSPCRPTTSSTKQTMAMTVAMLSRARQPLSQLWRSVYYDCSLRDVADTSFFFRASMASQRATFRRSSMEATTPSRL